MLYATVFHFLAGILTGSVFKVRTLLVLLFIILCESVVLAAVASELAAAWGIGNLLSIQTGYCAGVYLRMLAEQAGYTVAPHQIRSPE